MAAKITAHGIETPLGILTLGRRVDYPDVRYICEPRYADYIEGYKVKQMQYPDTVYSPAWVLENPNQSCVKAPWPRNIEPPLVVPGR